MFRQVLNRQVAPLGSRAYSEAKKGFDLTSLLTRINAATTARKAPANAGANRQHRSAPRKPTTGPGNESSNGSVSANGSESTNKRPFNRRPNYAQNQSQNRTPIQARSQGQGQSRDQTYSRNRNQASRQSQNQSRNQAQNQARSQAQRQAQASAASTTDSNETVPVMTYEMASNDAEPRRSPAYRARGTRPAGSFSRQRRPGGGSRKPRKPAAAGSRFRKVQNTAEVVSDQGFMAPSEALNIVLAEEGKSSGYISVPDLTPQLIAKDIPRSAITWNTRMLDMVHRPVDLNNLAVIMSQVVGGKYPEIDSSNFVQLLAKNPTLSPESRVFLATVAEGKVPVNKIATAGKLNEIIQAANVSTKPSAGEPKSAAKASKAPAAPAPAPQATA